MNGTDDGKNERTITDRLSVAPLRKGMRIALRKCIGNARTSSLGFIFNILHRRALDGVYEFSHFSYFLPVISIPKAIFRGAFGFLIHLLS